MNPVEIPLLPHTVTPIFLFTSALLCLCGLWLSDYALTTEKYSEPVADAMWFVGWVGGAISGAAFVLSMFQLLWP